MTLISLALTIIVAGILLWLVTSFIPMDGRIRQLLIAVVIIFLVLWILQGFGLLSGNLRLR